MLKAFYRQLRHLALNPDDKFHEHIRSRIGKRAVPSLENDLKEAILLMPDVTSRISILWGSLKRESTVKEVGSYFMTYMCHPEDFIPENESNGLFGYLDDAYLVALVYDLLTEELIYSGVHLSKGAEDLRKKMIGFKRKIKSVIPDEALKVQQMVGEILDGDDHTFSELFSGYQKTWQKEESCSRRSKKA